MGVGEEYKGVIVVKRENGEGGFLYLPAPSLVTHYLFFPCTFTKSLRR